MNVMVVVGHRDRGLCQQLSALTLAVAICSIASPRAWSQEFEGVVTRDPGSNLVTYTYQFKAPPTIELPVAQIALPVVPEKIAPGSVVSPVGWDAQLVVLPGSTFWDYDPLTDPKFLAGAYGPNFNAWIDPPLILWSANGEANAVMPGNVLAGFQFLSPFLPVNVPAQFQLIDGQVISIDPPSPGDQLAIPEPSSFLLIALAGLWSVAPGRLRVDRQPV